MSIRVAWPQKTTPFALTTPLAGGYNYSMKKNVKDNAAKVRGRARSMAVSIAQIAMFVALMAVGAYIRIPFPMVSLTFQTVISVLAGLLLGSKRGAVAMAVYAFVGLIGLPVFSSGGGFSYVLLPSFGYILGFIAAAAVAGVIAGGPPYSFARLLVAALAAMFADYIFGISYFIAVWTLNGYEGLWAAVVQYNLIYIPKDILLCGLAAVLARHVLPVISKMGGRR